MAKTRKTPDGARKRPARPNEGRPTLYRPEYCAAVIADMAAGYSLTAFAGSLGVSRNTIDNWRAENAAFDDACEIAKAQRLRDWEKSGLVVARGGVQFPGSATMVMFGLKNMGGSDWSDTSKHELTGKDGGPIPHVIELLGVRADVDPDQDT